MNLKQASVAEFKVIFDILLENARWLESKGIFQWPIDWIQDRRPEIRKSVDAGLFFYVEKNGDIAAIVEIKLGTEEISGNDELPALYVHKLAIQRKYSDQHLGRKILNLIETRATEENIKYIRLDCVAHNTKLREYYESCQFSFIKEVNAGGINFALYQFKIKG